MSDPSSSPVPGFRGWLLVLAVFQLLLALRQLVLLEQIVRSFVAGVPVAGIGPYSVLYGGRLALNAAFMILIVGAIVLMALRRSLFVRWGRIEMIGLIVLPIAEFAWLVVAPWAGGPGLISGPVIVLIVIHFAIGLAWSRYIAMSKRVAVTFVR
jgi:hypothetical protein